MTYPQAESPTITNHMEKHLYNRDNPWTSGKMILMLIDAFNTAMVKKESTVIELSEGGVVVQPLDPGERLYSQNELRDHLIRYLRDLKGEKADFNEFINTLA